MTTTTEDEILGRDSPSGDGLANLYLIRAGRLIRRSQYDRREWPEDPALAVAELRQMATVSREMAGICRDQGIPPGDYPARAYAASALASLIRDRFGA